MLSDDDDDFEPTNRVKKIPTNVQVSNTSYTRCKEKIVVNNHTKKLHKNSYMEFIREEFSKLFPCIITCKNSKYSNNTIRIYTNKCRQNECTRYYRFFHKFDNSTNDKIIYIDVKGGQIKHNELLTNQLRGITRTNLKKDLTNQYATDIQNQMVLNLDKDLKQSGNLKNFKSLAVLNTARSEALSNFKDDADDIKDLKIKIEKYENGHRLMTNPFTIYLLSKEQLEVLHKLQSEKSEITLHIDATGSVVKYQKKLTMI